jgi:hypothetical protein
MKLKGIHRVFIFLFIQMFHIKPNFLFFILVISLNFSLRSQFEIVFVFKNNLTISALEIYLEHLNLLYSDHVLPDSHDFLKGSQVQLKFSLYWISMVICGLFSNLSRILKFN